MVLTLTACQTTGLKGYVKDEQYDSEIDVTTLTIYYLENDEEFVIKLTGTEYDSVDGYVCFGYVLGPGHTDTGFLKDIDKCNLD